MGPKSHLFSPEVLLETPLANVLARCRILPDAPAVVEVVRLVHGRVERGHLLLVGRQVDRLAVVQHLDAVGPVLLREQYSLVLQGLPHVLLVLPVALGRLGRRCWLPILLGLPAGILLRRALALLVGLFGGGLWGLLRPGLDRAARGGRAAAEALPEPLAAGGAAPSLPCALTLAATATSGMSSSVSLFSRSAFTAAGAFCSTAARGMSSSLSEASPPMPPSPPPGTRAPFRCALARARCARPPRGRRPHL
eukprot:scaffold3394_cov385-Prasinococcus_capsulatus_cf.AAC.16